MRARLAHSGMCRGWLCGPCQSPQRQYSPALRVGNGLLALRFRFGRLFEGASRAAALLGGRVRNGLSAALGAPLLRRHLRQATFCEAVSSSARATTFALSGGDAPESGWQKLRENEGGIGYFFGEIWGGTIGGRLLTSGNDGGQVARSITLKIGGGFWRRLGAKAFERGALTGVSQ